MKSLFAFAQLVRLPNTFSAMADILLGALASGWFANRYRWIVQRPQSEGIEATAALGEELSQWTVLLGLLAASVSLYWSGMIWNDFFDVNQDKKERPDRPLPSGRISKSTALILGSSLMVLAVGLGISVDVLNHAQRYYSTTIVFAIIFTIMLYDGLLKKTVLGPLLMGGCRFFNILLGVTILGAWPPIWGWLLAMTVGIYICGVTWFARTEAHQSSPSMLIGAALVIFLSFTLAFTVPALALEVLPQAHPSLFFPYLMAVLGVYLGSVIIQAIRRPLPSHVQAVIRRAIMSLILFDAILASAFIGAEGLLLALLVIPGLILGRWMYST